MPRERTNTHFELKQKLTIINIFVHRHVYPKQKCASTIKPTKRREACNNYILRGEEKRCTSEHNHLEYGNFICDYLSLFLNMFTNLGTLLHSQNTKLVLSIKRIISKINFSISLQHFQPSVFPSTMITNRTLPKGCHKHLSTNG